MLALTLHVTKRSSWFWTRSSLDIEAEFVATDEIPFTSLIERLFSISPDFIPESSFSPNTPRLSDLRGRPRESFGASQWEGGSSNEEELFYTKGVLYEVDTPGGSTADNLSRFPEIPFTYKIATRFESFTEGAHIEHKVVHSADPIFDEVLPAVSARFFARLFPARIERIRLGMEAYRPKLSGNLFGMIPAIHDRLYLELSSDRIRLQASTENKGKDALLPFQERHLLRDFDSALKELKLFPNFSEQLAEHLGTPPAR